jgi:transcriptional regulator with XRE-family HTH domain
MKHQDMSIDVGEANFSGSSTRDYRDDLRDLMDAATGATGVSRYRICKEIGIDSGTLSNVLSKRRHFSLDKLIALLAVLGYRITYTAIKPPKN